MTALDAFRDDGPLAERLPRATGRLAWLVPPLLRALEYGGLIALTAAVDADAMPICFALLGVLAFHHYDTVYRLRTQGHPPPDWVRLAGGGWDGRLLIAAVLALVGGDALRAGMLAAAIALALLFVGESVAGWIRFAGAERPVASLDQENLED
jgi:Family of unknown function (DUF5941)